MGASRVTSHLRRTSWLTGPLSTTGRVLLLMAVHPPDAISGVMAVCRIWVSPARARTWRRRSAETLDGISGFVAGPVAMTAPNPGLWALADHQIPSNSAHSTACPISARLRASWRES